MNDPPKYDSYNLEELYSMANYIDQETYPERYALLIQEIQKQERYKSENPAKKSQGARSTGFGLGMWAGLGAAIWWNQVYVPTNQISNICTDSFFGLVGLVVVGVFAGGLIGGWIGASFGRK